MRLGMKRVALVLLTLLVAAVVATMTWWAVSQPAPEEARSHWQFAHQVTPASSTPLGSAEDFHVRRTWNVTSEGPGGVTGAYWGTLPDAATEFAFEANASMRVRLTIQQPGIAHRVECSGSSPGERREPTPVGEVRVVANDTGCLFVLPIMGNPEDEGPRLSWDAVPLPPKTSFAWSLTFSARSVDEGVR